MIKKFNTFKESNENMRERLIELAYESQEAFEEFIGDTFTYDDKSGIMTFNFEGVKGRIWWEDGRFISREF